MNFYPHHIGDFDNLTRISKLPMVYVLTTKDFKFIKVGQSTSFKQRLNNIQSGCPFELSLWTAIRTPKPSAVEGYLLKQLAHANTRGEWFAPDNEDLDFLSDFCVTTNRHIKEVHSALL